MILLTISLYVNSYGQQTDSLKCNISIVLDASESGDKISENLLLKFLETFGLDCRNNAEFSEFSNGTLYKVIQINPQKFIKILNDNLSKVDFNEILFNLENPVNDLIDLDLTINKIADVKIDKSIKGKLIIAINSGNWDESKKIHELKDSTVMFFIPDSTQFNSIAKSDNSEGIYEVSSDFGFYANKIIEKYKDSSLNVNISDDRFFIVNNQLFDRLEQKSPYGVLLVKQDKFEIETGVFTDSGLQQMINDFFKTEK
ncbi:MAG: hypothetical protein IH597_16175 [Bacteroidales bacterium]|nr:hypothetical protein [Bacteroidales bacterium]